MRCPFCGSDDTQVKDSRPAEDNTSIRRRRICPDCGGRFTTFERVQLRELMVLKKTGRKAPFARDKLVRSIPIASSAPYPASSVASKAPVKPKSHPRKSVCRFSKP